MTNADIVSKVQMALLDFVERASKDGASDAEVGTLPAVAQVLLDSVESGYFIMDDQDERSLFPKYIVRWDDHAGERHIQECYSLEDARLEAEYLISRDYVEYVEYGEI